MSKVRLQVLNETTGEVIEEVDVLTSAECVKFEDGETFQEKLNKGKLKGDTGARGPQGLQGPKGDTGAQGPQGLKGADGAKGATGAQGPKGDKGDKGQPGDGIRFGTSYQTSTISTLFLKKM